MQNKKRWLSFLILACYFISLFPWSPPAAAAPVITISNENGTKPAIASTVGGTKVIIDITDATFSKDLEVWFNKTIQAKTVLRTSDTRLSVIVPAAYDLKILDGQMTVEVLVKDLGNRRNYSTNTEFAYRQSKPDFDVIEPSVGTEGTMITVSQGVYGEFFRDVTKIEIYFGEGNNRQYVTNKEKIIFGDKKLTFPAPPGDLGQVPITVVNNDGGSWTSPASAFKYVITPKIETITPNHGGPGTKVKIFGPNIKADTIVKFGSVEVTEKEFIEPLEGGYPGLEVTVPSGLGTGTVSIEVQDPETGGSWLVPNAFILRTDVKPVIDEDGISPSSANRQGGTLVTIRGDNFFISADGIKPDVFFGDVKADADTVRVIDVNTIEVETPIYPFNGIVDVYVKNYDGNVSNKVPFEFRQTIGIDYVTPSHGSVEGSTPVLIKGYNFPWEEEDERTVQVFFGGAEVPEMEMLDSQTIWVKTPKGAVGTPHDVIVRIIDAVGNIEEQAVLKGAFTYVRPVSHPKILSIINPATNDNTGPKDGGIQVIIEGEDIRDGAIIYFGYIGDDAPQLQYKPGDILWEGTEFRLKGILPKVEIPGPYDVILWNPDGATDVLRNGFTFKGTNMWLSKITPEYGFAAGGTKVTLWGANFNEGQETPKVFFVHEKEFEGDEEKWYEAKNVVVSPDGSTITAVTPDAPPGRKLVVVRNTFGETTNKVYFTYFLGELKPEIKYTANLDDEGHEIIPKDEAGNPIPEENRVAKGSAAGGTRIAIVGAKFASGAFVTIAGKPATHVDVYSPERIYATIPPLEGSPGLVDVAVINRIEEPATGEIKEYTGMKQDGFFYYSSPVINNVSPRAASIYGGNIVTLSGEQFYPGAKLFLQTSEQLYEVEPKEIYVIDNQTLRFRVPIPEAGEHLPEGKAEIILVNVDGGRAQWEQFSLKKSKYEVAIHQVIPPEGPDTGNTMVTIKGEGFEPDAVVYFGLTPARNVEVRNGNTIVAVTPSSDPGLVDVTVSNTEDTSTAILYGGFEYKHIKTNPVITQVTPSAGPKEGGTKIVITGNDFWRTPVIYIGPYLTTNVKWLNETTITAVTDPGDVGTYDVILVNPDGATTRRADAFSYKSPGSNPEISSVYPNKAITQGGTVVTIKGKDFRKGVKVYLGDREAKVLELDESTEQNILYVQAPAHPAGEVDITVLNSDGGVAQHPGFLYVLPESHPVIASIEPNKGPMAGGTKVTIHGDDFRKDGLKVYFGGQVVSDTDVRFIRYDQIQVITPGSKVKGKVDVTVTNEEHPGSFTLPQAFEYIPSKPKIVNIVPAEGSYLGGTLVTMTGEDFTIGAAVYIGPWSAEIRELHTDVITIVTPPAGEPEGNPSNIGWWDVKVINRDGAEAVKKDGFRYLYPDSGPRISHIEPGEGPTLGGLPITIFGTDFRERAKVVIGGKEAEVLWLDDTIGQGNARIKVQTPPHSEGKKKVVVINYDGAESKEEIYFAYKKPLSFPEISAIDPKQGSTLGDTEVMITGIGFKDGARVWFGMNEAPKVEFIDYKTLRAITPSGNEGNVDVLVLNPDMGQTILPNAFKYIKTKELVIDSVNPNEGTAEGGTEITITGGPFDQGATAQVGGKPTVDVVVVDANTITAVTPPGEMGWQEVRVKNPDGGWAALAAGFFYVKPRTAPETPDWVDTDRKDRETIEVSWEPVEFANYYEIWISTSRTGKYRFLDQTTRTVYYATSLDPNQTYYFQIRAVNELGVSDFSYYEYARTGSGRIPEADLVPEKIIIETTNGSALATIATAGALASTGYRIDFTQVDYQMANRKAVRISQEALSQSYWPVTIEAPEISLSMPSSSLYLGLLGQEKAYAEVILMDLGQQEAERALRGLPRGSRIISPVYAVAWQVLAGTKNIPQSSFAQQVQLTMKYNVAITPGKQVSLYTYNPNTGKWVNTGAPNDPYAPQLSIGIINTGRFMLVEH